MKKKYFTEEERKAAKREIWRRANKRWRENHPEKEKEKRLIFKENNPEYGKQYRQEHKEELSEYDKQYRQTPMGRAHQLLSSYKRNDKERNRGECTLTAQWIADNIFTQKCHWCPETDWTKIGCDRIDNSLPHTPDNVIPCCDACNKKRGTKTYEEYLDTLRADEMTL